MQYLVTKKEPRCSLCLCLLKFFMVACFYLSRCDIKSCLRETFNSKISSYETKPLQRYHLNYKTVLFKKENSYRFKHLFRSLLKATATKKDSKALRLCNP